MSEQLTLFMYFFEEELGGHQGVPFYARDETHAQQRVADYLEGNGIQVKPGSRLVPFPDGFVVHISRLPGKVESK